MTNGAASVEGWAHYRAAEACYQAELARPRGEPWDWTVFDVRLRGARGCAIRDGDSHLVGACFELQGDRWEIAQYDGEALAAWGAALEAYQRIVLPTVRARHVDDVKQKIVNGHRYPRVFVSYARADKVKVGRVIAALEADGARVLCDTKVFIAGLDLSRLVAWLMAHVATERQVADGVEDALRATGIYLVCWSKRYATRPWTLYELECAFRYLERDGWSRGPRVVFVRLDRHPVPRVYRDQLWVDAGGRIGAATREALRRAVFESAALSPRVRLGAVATS